MIMSVIALIVRLAFKKHDDRIHPGIHSRIPHSIKAAMNQFNLASKILVYAVCPVCHCTYKPRIQPDSNELVYPPICTNKSEPESERCGELLLEVPSCGTLQRPKPRKTFAYHSFNDYLAGMLARPDIEKLMDESCDALSDLEAQMDVERNPNFDFVKDIFEAEFLKHFRGPNGNELFVKRPNNEGRYAFTLNVDYFNPEGMRTRGPKVSCGIISMACQNLPLDIRYKPENMYIAGIIPGPSEPLLTDLNHYLHPLIDDLKASWENGVIFSRTALHPTGRMTRSAIIAAVCDLPAARQAAGLAGHSSHFYCSVCQCHHRSTMGRSDIEDWRVCNPNLLRAIAIQWRDADSSAKRKSLFDEYGVRWSELWRLPYWDPTRQLVVDSMHGLFERIIMSHICDVLGLTTAAASAKEPILPAFAYNFTKLPPPATVQASQSATPASTTPNGQRPSRASSTSSFRVSPSPSASSSRTSPFHPQDSTAPSEKVANDINSIHRLLVEPISEQNREKAFEELFKKLSLKNADALDFVCMHDISGYSWEPGTKRPLRASMAKSIVEWVSA
jgi:Transposase family tnp2.